MNAFDSTKGYRPNYDIMYLEIGQEISKYYSASADRCDSIMYKARYDESGKGADITGWMDNGRIAIYDDYYFNWPRKGVLTVRQGINLEEYEYVEEIPEFEWELVNSEPIEICGYSCLSAKVKFRGRFYTAWFTLELPFNIGPWKFCGLPGLIMAVEESSGVFSWKAIGIEQKDGPIYIHWNKYSPTPGAPIMRIRKISRQQALMLEMKRWSDPYGFRLSSGGSITIGVENGGHIEFKEVTAANREQFALPEVPALELE